MPMLSVTSSTVLSTIHKAELACKRTFRIHERTFESIDHSNNNRREQEQITNIEKKVTFQKLTNVVGHLLLSFSLNSKSEGIAPGFRVGKSAVF